MVNIMLYITLVNMKIIHSPTSCEKGGFGREVGEGGRGSKKQKLVAKGGRGRKREPPVDEK